MSIGITHRLPHSIRLDPCRTLQHSCNYSFLLLSNTLLRLSCHSCISSSSKYTLPNSLLMTPSSSQNHSASSGLSSPSSFRASSLSSCYYCQFHGLFLLLVVLLLTLVESTTSSSSCYYCRFHDSSSLVLDSTTSSCFSYSHVVNSTTASY